MPLDLNNPASWIFNILPTPFGPIPYWVLADLESYHEEFADNASLTRVLIAVPWNKRGYFRKYALGFAEINPAGNFIRHTPLPCPYQANQYLVSLRKARIHVGTAQASPHPPLFATPDTNVPNGWFKLDEESYGIPPRIVYDAVFGCLPYDVLTQAFMAQYSIKEMARFVIREREVRARERRAPSVGYETAVNSADTALAVGSGTPIPEVGFFPYTDWEFTLTLCRWPLAYVPWTAIAECNLKTNAVPFDYKAKTADPSGYEYGHYLVGDILFLGLASKIRPYRDPHGQFLVDLPYVFRWQPADGQGNGHNKVPCAYSTHPRRWITIRERVAPGAALYASEQLERLFEPEP